MKIIKQKDLSVNKKLNKFYLKGKLFTGKALDSLNNYRIYKNGDFIYCEDVVLHFLHLNGKNYLQYRDKWIECNHYSEFEKRLKLEIFS